MLSSTGINNLAIILNEGCFAEHFKWYKSTYNRKGFMEIEAEESVDDNVGVSQDRGD